VRVVHVEAGRHLYGGAEQVRYLVRGLAAEGVEQVVVTAAGSEVAGSMAELRVRSEPIPMRGELDLSVVPRLAALIRGRGADLVHLHSRRGADTLGALAARRAGVPIVLSRRVDNPEPAVLARLRYRLPDRVVAISRAIYELLREVGVPERKLACIRSAVDVDRYRPEPDTAWLRDEFGLGPDADPVGMVAQFIERKGHADLLRAAPGILRRRPSTVFLLFGRGPLESTIRARVRELGLEHAVVFAGFRADLPRILPGLRLLIHPAHREGLGVALLQASACGVPIVAYRAGGIPEIVRPDLNGVLVEPGDVDGLARAASAILEDSERAGAMARAARRLAVEELSVQKMTAAHIELYTKLLTHNPRARG
jgi:glycosyltransferase involved in cell wall biosynthesis